MILLLLSKGPSDERLKIIRVTVEINAHKGLLEQELEKHMLYSFTKGRWLKKKV